MPPRDNLVNPRPNAYSFPFALRDAARFFSHWELDWCRERA